MKIGIIAAMKEELNAFTKILKDLTQREEQSPYHISTPVVEWHFGKMETKDGDVEIVALQSGVGKAQAALHTALLLQIHKVDFIINIGSAGGLMTEGNYGDIVIAKSLAYHDVDVTPFGYEHGQLPNNPVRFPTHPVLRRTTLEIANEFLACDAAQIKGPGIKEHGNKAIVGEIVSGDVFVEHGSQHIGRICQQFPDALAVEMEGAAIAHIAFLYGCPCLIVRSISDFPLRPDGKIDFQQYLPLAASNAAQIVQRLIYKHSDQLD